MVVSGYVTSTPHTSNAPGALTLGNTVHSQITCSTVRDPSLLVMVQVQEQADRTFITHRGMNKVVALCTMCPSVLDWEWQDRAECRSTWPDVDMMTVRSERAPILIERFCGVCPVVVECADFSLSMASTLAGIWGGVHVPNGNNPKRHRAAIAELRVVAAKLQPSA